METKIDVNATIELNGQELEFIIESCAKSILHDYQINVKCRGEEAFRPNDYLNIIKPKEIVLRALTDNQYSHLFERFMKNMSEIYNKRATKPEESPNV